MLTAGAASAGLLAGGVWLARDEPKPVAPVPIQIARPVAAMAPVESLQARNLRISKETIAPQLVDLLQHFYEPPHVVQLVGVWAVGSEVEVEFQIVPPPPTFPGMAGRLRGRYCLIQRRLTVYGQPHGDTKWYWMDPERPIVFEVKLLGKRTEVVRGREEFATALKLFDQLPPDERAEPDEIRALFGEPGGELLLPARSRGVSGFPGGLVMATEDGALYVRDVSGQWRSAGVCPGWHPVVAVGRVYCQMSVMVRSRRLDAANEPWVKLCDLPAVAPGEHDGRLNLAGEHLYLTIKPHGFYSRPLNDPTIGWPQCDHSLSSIGVGGNDRMLFTNDGKQLFRRPAATPNAAWVPIGPWPDTDRLLTVDGDRLLAYSWFERPIYARPLTAKLDDPWTVVGRTHDPFQH